MTEAPILVPQRTSSVIYELVKNRLINTEFKGLPQKERSKKMHKVNTAYRIAKEAHYDQERDSGEDYFKNHVLPVLQIYLDELRGTSLAGVLSAILHDTVEDRPKIVDLDVIRKLISEQVAHNVDYLSKPSYASYLPADQRDIYNGLHEEAQKEFIKPRKSIIGPTLVKEYFEKMRKSANDETIRVKVADRLHNLRTLPDDIDWIQKYIEETEQYIIPIVRGRDMQREKELLERELVRLKVRLHTLSTQNSLGGNLHKAV